MVASCASIKDLIDEPTALGEFEVSRNYEGVFRSLKSYALQRYQEKTMTIKRRLMLVFRVSLSRQKFRL